MVVYLLAPKLFQINNNDDNDSYWFWKLQSKTFVYKCINWFLPCKDKV